MPGRAHPELLDRDFHLLPVLIIIITLANSVTYLLKKVVVKMLELPWKTYHSYETKPNDLITLSANLYENL